MKKSYRIRKNEEFSRIIKKKRYFANACFGVYIDNKQEENARVGISVSKRLGDAVTRNKIKRQVRMMFLNIFNFDASNYDIVCIIKPKYLNNAYKENELELEKLIKKAIINEDK